MFDAAGNRIAEYNEATGALIQEYVWFNGAPLAVIEGGVINFIRSDHIGRPVLGTNSTGTKVWTASYLPFGGVRTTTGTVTNLRFPGQWFQSESGLHQNWMRDYDPTTGRYLQADPLGLVDGASVYGYVKQNPGRWVDPRGLRILPQSHAPVKKTSDLVQCQAGWESCEQMREEEEKNCRNRFGAMTIADRKACMDRARDRFNLCFSGVPESSWPPEWSDGDEDVPNPTHRFDTPVVGGPGFWGAVGLLLGTLGYGLLTTF